MHRERFNVSEPGPAGRIPVRLNARLVHDGQLRKGTSMMGSPLLYGVLIGSAIVALVFLAL